MKSNYLRFPRSAWIVAVMSVLTLAAEAADRPARFAVPNNQMQVLGIQVAPLQAHSGAAKASFPAQVVIPPKAEHVVSSPVAGMVVQLLVQQNQVVRAGEPLLRISSPELGQLQLQLLQSAARATLARQTAQREKALFDEGIIPQRRVQESQASLAEANAALDQARGALRLSGMSAPLIERIASSGKPQDNMTLMASQSGIVSMLEVKPGQRVEAATSLLHIVQTDVLWLDIQLPVSENANWPIGTKFKVAGRDITARIMSTGSTVSSSSQTVVLRAAVEGNGDRIRPGEFVTVELPLATTQDAWDVPLAAVAHDGVQAYVFVRTGDKFEARQVQVIASAGQRVSVRGALKAGEQIAVAGVVALKGAWLAAQESK